MAELVLPVAIGHQTSTKWNIFSPHAALEASKVRLDRLGIELDGGVTLVTA